MRSIHAFQVKAPIESICLSASPVTLILWRDDAKTRPWHLASSP